MAAITSDELLALRRRAAASSATQTWTKAQVNAALQAIEDLMETTGRTAINNAIEGAAPGVFNGAQKRLLFAAYCEFKFRKGG